MNGVERRNRRSMAVAAIGALAGCAALLAAAPTAPATVDLVADVAPGRTSSSIQDIRVAGRRIYFQADDVSRRGPVHGSELWVTNGTRRGTRIVKDIARGRDSSYPHAMTPDSKGTIFFWATDKRAGTEIWRTRGTAASTRRIKDLLPGPASSNDNWSEETIVTIGTGAYFVGYQSRRDSVRRLWYSDGTAAGTRPVGGIDYSQYPLSPEQFTRLGSSLYFVYAGALWRATGRQATIVKASVVPRKLVAAGGKLYFIGYDGVHGWELWRSDGTPAGTAMVSDLAPGKNDGLSLNGDPLVPMGGRVYFTLSGSAGPSAVWTSDGTAQGTRYLTDASGAPLIGGLEDSAVAAGRLYLARYNATGSRGTLWRTDGSPDGTFALPASSARVSDLEPAGRRVYFVLRGSLWTSDGTPAGTRRVGRPAHLDYGSQVALGERLVFAGEDRMHGFELRIAKPPR